MNDALEGDGPALLPLSPDIPAPQMRTLLETMRPASVRTPDGVESTAFRQGVAQNTALTIATSGSTGVPKGVELSADALLHSARASVSRVGAREGQTWLCVLPTAHVSGLQVMLRAHVLGGRALHLAFDPESAMDVAAEHRPHVSLVPTQLRRLLAAGADLSLFRTVFLGGAAAGAELLDAARAAGARVVTTYGMSETGGGCVYDGVPLDGVAADVAADGGILLSGPVLFNGYRLRPDLTGEQLITRDGRRWFRTGDLGSVDARGRLRVRGRVDDVINTGGHKVVAGEVTALLNQLDSVAEAAVVGRADPEWGQRVSAVVVPADPANPPTLAELRDWVSAHLPRYAAPHELDLRAELPMLASGKPDLRALSG